MQAAERQAGLPPAVVVHGLQHARAALAARLPVLLLSGPGAAAYAGAGWWRAMIAAARDTSNTPDCPDALDCADLAGRALEALAVGCRIIILHPCPAYAAVVERAGPALVLPARPPCLDLGQPGAERQLLNWLQARAVQGDRSGAIG